MVKHCGWGSRSVPKHAPHPARQPLSRRRAEMRTSHGTRPPPLLASNHNRTYLSIAMCCPRPTRPSVRLPPFPSPAAPPLWRRGTLRASPTPCPPRSADPSLPTWKPRGGPTWQFFFTESDRTERGPTEKSSLGGSCASAISQERAFVLVDSRGHFQGKSGWVGLLEKDDFGREKKLVQEKKFGGVVQSRGILGCLVRGDPRRAAREAPWRRSTMACPSAAPASAGAPANPLPRPHFLYTPLARKSDALPLRRKRERAIGWESDAAPGRAPGFPVCATSHSVLGPCPAFCPGGRVLSVDCYYYSLGVGECPNQYCREEGWCRGATLCRTGVATSRSGDS